MSQLRVVLLDHARAAKTLIEVPDDVPISRLLPALVSRLYLPTQSEGRPVNYVLVHKEAGHRLQGDETLRSAGVGPGAVLSVLPEMVTGETKVVPPSPEKLGAIDDVFEVIADLRLQVEGMRPESKQRDSQSTSMSELDGRLETFLDRLRTQFADESARQYGELLDQLRKEVELQQSINEIKAPVEIPTPEQMKVKLVPSHLLTRLEETRFDQNRWDSVGWAFVGAILGVLINWVTAEQVLISRPALVIMAAFAVISTLAFVAARRYSRRAETVRIEMMKAGLEADASFSDINPAG